MSDGLKRHKKRFFNICIHKMKIKHVKYLTINCKDCDNNGGYLSADELED